MSGSDVVVIVLSLVSLLFSILSAIFATIVSTESRKAKARAQRKKAEAKARASSRVEVPEKCFDEIIAQSKDMQEDSREKIYNVQASRVFPHVDPRPVKS